MTLDLFPEAAFEPGGATFSSCGRYRYTLTRRWATGKLYACFVMLNPSTADASENDPTVRRCIDYATRWGYGGLVVVNIFAWRSTDPDALEGVDDPVGPENDAAILDAAKGADMVIAAWGVASKLAPARSRVVLDLFDARGVVPLALAYTKAGHPRHPLYLRADLIPRALVRPT